VNNLLYFDILQQKITPYYISVHSTTVTLSGYNRVVSFRHAEDIRKLLSPVLFIDFGGGLVLMCTTAFQVAVVIIMTKIRNLLYV
jgi:hypothetical protein